MNKAITIAKWEFLQKVKSKAFLISLVVTPLIIIGFSIGPALLAENEEEKTRSLGLLDSTGVYIDEMMQELSQVELENGDQRFDIVDLDEPSLDFEGDMTAADARLLNENLQAYLLITQRDDEYYLEYRTQHMGSFGDRDLLKNTFNAIRRDRLYSEMNIDSLAAARLENDTWVRHVKVDEKGESEVDFMSQYLTSLLSIMLLFFLILFTGGMLVRSMVEEKSNRLIEIIVSSCKAEELLAGKVLGLSMLAIFQLAVWGGLAIAIGGPAILMFAPLENLALMLVFLVLGFVLYTAIFVGIGSIVTTEQEAQQITSYLSMVLVAPVVVLFPMLQNPDQLLIKVLSYFPLTTTPVMLVRINAAKVPLIEVIIAIVILMVSTWLLMLLAGKVFRIGILSYGKMPSIKELMTWIKMKE